MKEAELNALISLLDDSDPEVSDHVWEKLSSMGSQGIDRLEAAWEMQGDPVIQKKIEDLIYRINLDGVARDLLNWRKEGGKDLMEGWMLVTRTQFQDLNEKHYSELVNRLGHKVWLELQQQMDPVHMFRIINLVFFKSEGFKPNRKEVKLPENSLLNMVMDHHTGNAIGLSVLYLLICRKLDLPVSGIILPGYFVLHYIDHKSEYFIDVFNGGVLLTRDQWTAILKKYKIEEKPSYFKPTSNIYIILELISTLANDLRGMGKDHKADELDQLLKDIEIKFEP
ncbi:MAG: hypothetical protein H6581_01325 [Bacteroidia bacterium]|nr:hypothetical protein [Bacteroidia bacterium]